jgi:hypothetical protein
MAHDVATAGRDPRAARGRAGSEPDASARRPAAIALSVADLLDDVHAGRIRVPSVRRALKWKRRDIRLLLDSIYRGYPIGTMLLWKKPADAAVVQVGPVRIDAPAHQDARWVVDGQQRITALTGVLTGPYDDIHADHALFFDLQAQEFQRAGKKRQPPPHWLPLDQVVDWTVLFSWLQERRAVLQGDVIDAAIQLGKRIREYQVHAYVVETDDEQRLREIFDRMNRGGHPLEASDVFRALHGAGARISSGLDDVAVALRDMDFGDIDRDILAAAVLAVAGKEPGRGIEQLDRSEVPDALARTLSAVQRVIVFLRKECGIPHEALMPSPLLLIALARFFSLNPEPAPRSLSLLACWVWRGAMGDRHRDDTIRETLQAIVEDEDEAVQNLLCGVGSRPHEMPPLTPYSFASPHSRLQLLALWSLAPRHIVTGAPLRLGELMQSDGPAQPIMRAGKNADEQTAAGLANRLLHPPLPGGLRKPLVAQSSAAILASHGITPEAHARLASGDFAAFLRLREDVLRLHIERFLEKRAQWDASDRPPIAHLIIEDD